MNKKLIISLGLVAALTATAAVYAETTIYTDGIGRMHFLGRDAANNVNSGSRYSNSADQDLTRKLYEQAQSGVVNDTTYDQHPLKNYENTFPDSRFGTSKVWKTKYANGAEDAVIEPKDGKKIITATKGATDPSNPYVYGTTILDNPNVQNEVKTTAKKHWWNRNK